MFFLMKICVTKEGGEDGMGWWKLNQVIELNGRIRETLGRTWVPVGHLF